MKRGSALALLGAGLLTVVAAALLPPWLMLPLWFLAQPALDFGGAALLAPASGPAVQLDGRRVLLWLGLLAAGSALLLALLGLPLWWLRSGGGLPAFLAASGLAAGSVFLLRREYAWAAQILFTPVPEARSLTALNGALRKHMWDAGDPLEHYWSHGFWVNLALLLRFLGAITVCTAPFLQRAPTPQLGYALLLPALGLWVIDRLLLAHGRATASEPEPPAASLGEDESDEVEWLAAEPAASVDLDALLVDAVRRGDGAAVAQLLERGASPDAEPAADARDRRSALVGAATCGQPAILQQLIRAGADLNRLSHGLNPLLAATRDCYDGRPEVVRLLLDGGARPELADAGGATPLHHAALNRDPAVARHLLDAGAPLEALDGHGRSPLGCALLAGNWAIAELLLQAGARLEPAPEPAPAPDPDAAIEPAPTPGPVPLAPLILAASGTADDASGVRRLLDLGVRTDAVDGQGRSALHHAAELDHGSIAEALLGAGAAVDASDAQGQTALMLAAAHGSKRVLRRLIFWKADAGRLDRQRRNALHHAALGEGADAEVVDLLLTLGCDPEQRDAEQHNAFELALAMAHWEVARRLNPGPCLSDALEEASAAADLSGDRAALVVQALHQGRVQVALELLALGPLPPEVLADAVLAAEQALDPALLDALRTAGLQLGASAAGLHLLNRLCARRPLPARAIELLLDAGAGVQPDSNGASPLVLLCGPADPLASGAAPPSMGGERQAVLRLVRLLLKRGAQLDGTDAQGRSALSQAVQHGSAELVGTLLDAGADPNRADRAGRTPLYWLVLCRRGDAELLLRALVLAGADPAIAAADGSTPFGVALQRELPDLARLLDWPPGAHPRRPLGGADLATAAQLGQHAVVERLLALGVPVDGRDARGASAALHAAGRGDLDLLEILLDGGADLQAAASSGLTPFGAAALAGQHAVLRWLTEQRCAIDAPQAQGLSALALAAARGDTDTADLLLDLGANPNGGLPERSPVRIALRALLGAAVEPERGLRLLAQLLQAGADPNSIDGEARSLLLLCVGAGQGVAPLPEADDQPNPLLADLVALLHQQGAELNLPDRQGRTALHWACRHGLLHTVAQLLRLGADPDLPDDLRKLPVDLAQARHRSDLHAILRAARGG